MKVTKSKCKVPHLGQSNPTHKYRLGREWIDIISRDPTRKQETNLFSTRANSDWGKSNDFKLKDGGFRLGIKKKKFFTMRVVRCWNGLPREAVNALSLEVFKARLDGALGNLVQWKLSLPTAGIEFVWSFRSLSTQSIL